jgi:hypothetical protein
MFLKLIANLRMVQPRPKHVVLLNKIKFSCVQTIIKLHVLKTVIFAIRSQVLCNYTVLQFLRKQSKYSFCRMLEKWFISERRKVPCDTSARQLSDDKYTEFIWTFFPSPVF